MPSMDPYRYVEVRMVINSLWLWRSLNNETVEQGNW